MSFKEFIINFKNKLLNRTKKLPENIDYYSKFTESINDIELIKMFEEQIPQDLRKIIDNTKGNIYNRTLSTPISSEQLMQITKSFFGNFDNEISVKINRILDKKDNRFNLNVNSSVNGENKVSNPNKIPVDIDVTQYGDLRDVYGLVHELTHCLDIDNGDNDTRKILGEVAPQCMERMLDKYLIENCEVLGFNSKTLLNDIEKRKFTTFVSRAQNAIHFNNLRKSNLTRTLEQEKDSRYVLAQIYQSQLMKDDIEQAKNKLTNFINYIKDNDFDGANKTFGIQIKKDNKLQRNNIVKDSIAEGSELYNSLIEEANNIKDFNIDKMNFNNSYIGLKNNIKIDENIIDER